MTVISEFYGIKKKITKIKNTYNFSNSPIAKDTLDVLEDLVDLLERKDEEECGGEE